MAKLSTPHLNHVPVIAGGHGAPSVRDFYDRHLVGQFFPEDVVFTPVSRTIDDHQIVDEIVISFTHTRAIDFMLPGVPPTGVEQARLVLNPSLEYRTQY